MAATRPCCSREAFLQEKHFELSLIQLNSQTCVVWMEREDGRLRSGGMSFLRTTSTTLTNVIKYDVQLDFIVAENN